MCKLFYTMAPMPATHSMSIEASVVNEIFKLSVQYGTIICQINLFLHSATHFVPRLLTMEVCPVNRSNAYCCPN